MASEKRPRSWPGTAALLLGAILVSILAGEIVVRLLGAAPDVVMIEAGRFRLSANPKLGYEPRPGAVLHEGSLDLIGFRGAGNALGYRDRDHAFEKPAGRFRIVVLGDSIAAGLYVERIEEVFPFILERKLNEAGLPAEVINLSVSGYNTQQEVELLKELGLRYDPDLILLAYCLNDVSLNEGGIVETLIRQERDSGGIPFNRVAGRFLVRSALYRFLRYGVFPPKPDGGTASGDPRLKQLGRDTTAESFRELGRVAGEAGVPVLVAIFPELSDLDNYKYYGDHARVGELAEGLGMRHLDLAGTIKYCAVSIEGEIGYDRYHLTPPGHACAADALAMEILEEFPVDGRP